MGAPESVVLVSNLLQGVEPPLVLGIGVEVDCQGRLGDLYCQ